MLSSYLYDFPFLGDDSTITVDDNCVDPLYKHVFPIEVAPDLSFIGVPWKVNLCPNFCCCLDALITALHALAPKTCWPLFHPGYPFSTV